MRASDAPVRQFTRSTTIIEIRLYFAVEESFALMLINVQEPIGVEEHVAVFRKTHDGRRCVRIAKWSERVAVRRAVGVEGVLIELIKRKRVRAHGLVLDD